MKKDSRDDDVTQTYELISAGTIVSHYRIVKRIGIGGMGEVYLAEDVNLDRKVALKFLVSDLCEDDRCRTRFRLEAQAAAQLNHTNIITIHDISEYRGRPYFVMEYVDGQSLRKYMSSRKELSIRQILVLSIQVTEGLSEAHSHGIIHRDLKPSNILLDANGRVRVVDFGLAAVKAAFTADGTGEITGTAGYMSPEQVQGQEIDSRSDLFSLGVVMYELIAGEHPFKRDSDAFTFQAVLESDAQPVSAYRFDVPAGLERSVKKLLEKDRERRYQQAEDVRSDLMSLLKAHESIGAKATSSEKGRLPSIAVLPFTDLSEGEKQEYFCEGMAEEIINALTKVRGLQVTARAAAFRFKATKHDIREVGRLLNVHTLLKGSVRRSGRRLRITAQLIDVAGGYHLWSERFDREVKDIFEIQDEIAENIVRALRVILSDDEQLAIVSQATPSIEAYDYYLRGRQYFHQRRKKSLEYAREMFMRATEIDPTYALAWAGVADCCSLLVHFYGESSGANIEQADLTSKRSLELDPGLTEAHGARGFALWLMKRHEEADREFETAIRMDPNHFEAHYFFARSCLQRGELERAAQLLEKASAIRDDFEAHYFTAQTYTALKRKEEAEVAYDRAVQAVKRHLELNPDDARAVTMGAVALCRLGESERGLEWAERAIAIDPDDAGIRYNVACLYALEGNRDRAIECLEDAVRAGFAHKDWVANDPDLDSLRDDPRFKSLKWRE